MARRPVNQEFRPLKFLPCLGILILIITLIVMYAIFVSVFGTSKDLVLSRILSLEILCQEDNLLATFVPNIGTLGLPLGFFVVELVFFLRYIKNRLIKPRAAVALLIIGTVGTVSMVWMVAFPTGRGNPSDLFHQVTAGLGVFAFLLHSIVTAIVYKTKRPLVRRALAVLLSLTAIGMLIVFILEMRGKASSTVFAIFQFVYMGLLFIYFWTLSDSTAFCAQTKTKGESIRDQTKLRLIPD